MPLITSLLAVLLAAPSVSSQKEEGVDALGLPLVSFNSDQGVGFGAAGGAYFYSRGYAPYRHALGAQVFFTTGGSQNHWLRYDAPDLFGKVRFEARAEFRRERYSPYYGPGNLTEPGFDGPSNDPRFNYDRLSPGGFVRLRMPLVRPDFPLQGYVSYGFRYTKVDPYPGSLLVQEAPVGIAGGPTGQLQAGLLVDTRDDESDPTSGGLEEVALRGSAEPTGSKYRYGGVTLSERRFFPLGSKNLIFAQRITADFLFGDVPFFEWANTGGLYPTEGIGGMSSVRGVPRQRFAGDVKVFSNTELRYSPYAFNLFGALVRVGGLAFVDVGHVWHPHVYDGGAGDWHFGVGGGIRLARRAAVVRLDVAYAPQLNRSGVYATFGQMF